MSAPQAAACLAAHSSEPNRWGRAGSRMHSLTLGQVLGGVVAGRPVGPDPVAAECLVQRDLVGGHHAGVDMVAVRGELRRGEPAVERGNCPVALPQRAPGAGSGSCTVSREIRVRTARAGRLLVSGTRTSVDDSYLPHRHHRPLPSAGGTGVGCPSPRHPAGMAAATITLRVSPRTRPTPGR